MIRDELKGKNVYCPCQPNFRNKTEEIMRGHGHTITRIANTTGEEEINFVKKYGKYLFRQGISAYVRGTVSDMYHYRNAGINIRANNVRDYKNA